MSARKQPKIIGYMASLYDTMSKEAQKLSAEDGGDAVIWQGRLVATCISVGIPEGYYKRVVDTLRKMECIEVVSRGRRGSVLTVIVLRHPPTEERYEDAIVKSGWQGLTETPSLDTLAGQVRDLLQTLGGLDIRGVFKNHEDRVQALEEQVSALQTAVEGLQQQPQQLHKHNKGE